MSSYRFLERRSEPRIAWCLDPAKGEHRGSVLLFHGYADHAERFARVAALWQEQGLTVARFDHRGHGRSEGPRGHIGAFDDYVRDALAVLAAVEQEEAWHREQRPVLFGHSMGGLIATHMALAIPARIAGLAATSPFYGLSKPLPKVMELGAKVLGRFVPTLRQPSDLSGSDMTHDTAIVQAYDADPLRFGHVTTGWYREIIKAQAEALARASSLRVPFFCIAAGDDRVVSTPTIERFFSRLTVPDKELIVKKGLFHEVLNEPDYKDHVAQLATRMLRWTSARAG
jgi:alpha-beta hydrolase superfamily lysophospholipase